MGGRALRTRRSPSLAVRAPACMPAPFSGRDARLPQPPASPHSLRERPLPLMWERVRSPRPGQRDRGGVEGQVPTTECGAGGCCGEPRAGWQCGGRTRVRSCWRAACQRQPPRQRSQYASTDHAGRPWTGLRYLPPAASQPGVEAPRSARRRKLRRRASCGACRRRALRSAAAQAARRNSLRSSSTNTSRCGSACVLRSRRSVRQ